MDNIRLLAEKILVNAAKDSGGHCYPSQIVNNKSEIAQALDILELYGHTYPMAQGSSPIFTINDSGRYFLNMGAWSGQERAERIAQERHQEEMKAMRTNNKLVKWSIIATVVVGLITALISLLR